MMNIRKILPCLFTTLGFFHLTSCDSSGDFTADSSSLFDLDVRYDGAVLAANPNDIAHMPAALFPSETITTTGISASNSINEALSSSGQLFLGNFRFNYTKQSTEFRDVNNITEETAIITRSDDHRVNGAEFVSSLESMRDSAGGDGSLSAALTIDQGIVGENFVDFTNSEVNIILNAVRSLGHQAEIDEDTKFFRVLVNQQYNLTSTSTNQDLINTNKITGTIELTKVWQQFLFERQVELDEFGNIEDTESKYTIILGSDTVSVTEAGTFEIQLNSL